MNLKSAWKKNITVLLSGLAKPTNEVKRIECNILLFCLLSNFIKEIFSKAFLSICHYKTLKTAEENNVMRVH